MDIDLFYRITIAKVRENSFKLTSKRFRMDTRKIFSMERVVKHRKSQPREVV